MLELALREEGRSVADALDAVLHTAVAADRLGYRRVWVSEHHRIPAMSTPSPAVVIARLAAATTTIRVGAGGVMLGNHSALATAEAFATLEAMFPGRIDLGLGRGPGTYDDEVLAALRERRPDGPTHRDEVHAVLEHLETDPDAGLAALPDGTGTVPCWLLASSAEGAQLAGELGLPLALAHHLRPDGTEEAAAAYREHFRPSPRLDHPWLALSTLVVCATTRDEAVALARPGATLVSQVTAGPPTPLIPPDAPIDPDLDVHGTVGERGCIGTPEDVRSALVALAERTGADELQLVVPVYDATSRIEVLERLSAVWPTTRAAHRAPRATTTMSP